MRILILIYLLEFFLSVSKGQIILKSNFDYFDSKTNTYYNRDERTVTTSLFQNYNSFVNQAYVSNGYIGSRIPNIGFGFTYDQNENASSSLLSNGWPLLNKRFSGAFIAGFFDAQSHLAETNFPEVLGEDGKESVISSIPQWSDLKLTLHHENVDFILDPKLIDMNISDYSQSLNMQKGIVKTKYRWMDLLDIEVSVIAHRSVQSLGVVNLKLSSRSNLNLTLESFLDFNSSQRCELVESGYSQNGIFMTVNPDNVQYKKASIYSILKINDETVDNFNFSTTLGGGKVSQLKNLQLNNESMFIAKYVGIASDDLLSTSNSSKVFEVAKETALEASCKSWQQILLSHEMAWDSLWSSNKINIENDILTTFAAESSLYHLFSNTRASNSDLTSALSVSGLSSDSYGGMVFWDTDFWTLPALIPILPEHAISVFRYRSYQHKQAKENAKKYGYDGSVYPWTSGRFGNCTGTGPCVDYEYHINIAICYSLWKLYLSGSIDETFLKDYGWPILNDTATFFSQYVKFDEALGKYTTHNLTDPDEYANFKNNTAYTNFGIAQVMKWTLLVGNELGLETAPKLFDIMENMYLPVSAANITLEYDGMTNDISVKQADVVLISFIDDQDGFLPGYFNYDKQRAINDLTYYSDHQSSQGPAMTFPVFVAVSEKLNDYGCSSQTYHIKSFQPFLRFPFGQMSEQNDDNYDTNGGTHPAFPFLTGHSGILQSTYYGLLGIRFSYALNPDTADIQRILHVDPAQLPLFDGSFTIDSFKYMNESLDIRVDRETFTLRRQHINNAPITIYVDSRNKKKGYHTLNDSLVLPLFTPGFNIDGSLTECHAFVRNIEKGMPGDIANAIIDGDNATTWQALTRYNETRLLIDLKEEKNITSGCIVWGNRPAQKFSLFTISDTYTQNDMKSGNYKMNLLLDNHLVSISSEYDPNSSVVISNMNYTHFDLPHTFTSRFVIFSVLGVLDIDDDPEGAKIAEFSLFDFSEKLIL